MNNLDPKMLQLALQGDEAAFNQVVDTYQNPVYNLCYRLLGDGIEAEDAAQETFWRAFPAYPPREYNWRVQLGEIQDGPSAAIPPARCDKRKSKAPTGRPRPASGRSMSGGGAQWSR